MKKKYLFALLFCCSLGTALAQNASQYTQRGQALAQQGNYTEAIRNYTLAISLEPANALSYALRASAKTKALWYEPAIDDYSLAIKLNGNDTQSLLNRGITYIKLGKYTEAIQDFDRVIGLQDDFSLAWFMRAEAKYKSIQGCYATQKPYSYREIVADYTKAVNLDKNFALAFHQRGAARMDSLHSSSRLISKNELASICQDWYMAVDLGDASVEGVIKEYCGNEMPEVMIHQMWQIARSLQGGNRSLEMLSLLDQLIDTRRFDLDPVYEALQTRIEFKLKNKELSEALQDAELLLSVCAEASPQRAKALYLRALCLANLRKFTQALLDMDEAILLGYQTSWVYYERGNLQYELNNQTQACLDWQESKNRGDKRAEDKLKIYCKTGIFKKR